MRFYVLALVLGTATVAMLGCETPGSGDANASYDTGTGRQAGSIIGGQVGREHGYVGSHVGGLIGQQTERSVTQER